MNSVFFTFAVLVLLSPAAHVEAGRRHRTLRTLMATYLHPTETAKWDTVLNALTDNGVRRRDAYIIVNPAGGVIVNTSYATEIDDWKSLIVDRIKPVANVIAYVNLCDKKIPFPGCGGDGLQGARPAALVLEWVQDWIMHIGKRNIDGFFLDDTPMDGADPDIKANIIEIINGIRALKRRFKVYTNPGIAATDVDLIKMVTATVHDEGTLPDSAPKPNEVYHPNGNLFGTHKFAMILHTVDEVNWVKYLGQALQYGYGYFYVTSGSYAEVAPYINDVYSILPFISP